MNPSSASAAVERISEPLCQPSAPNQRLRMLCLQHMCNAVPSSQPMILSRAFTIALKAANAAGLADAAAPSARKVHEIAKGVRNQPQLERDLWLAARDALAASDTRGSELEAHSCAVRYLQTFQGTPESELDQAAEVASEVVVSFLNRPNSFQADFAQLDPIQQLRNEKDHRLKHQILETLVKGTLSEMQTLLKERQLELSTSGINSEVVLRKMRLNMLVQIAEDTMQKPMEKGFVASQLDVDSAAIDSWIISAMGANLLDASIDEMNGTVTFTRASPRVFGAKDWESLRGRLASWRDRLIEARSQLHTRISEKAQTSANPLSATIAAASQ
jgi:hypothetical protein